MFRKATTALVVLALLFRFLCVSCAAAEDPSSVNVTVTEFTFPVNYLNPEGPSLPSVSVEKADDAWILSTDYVPAFSESSAYVENRIKLRDRKRVRTDAPAGAETGDVYESEYDGILDFKPDGDVWSTRKIRRGINDGTFSNSMDQLELQFDPEQVADMSFRSSSTDWDTETAEESEISVQWYIRSVPTIVVSVTDRITMYSMPVAQVRRIAAYNAETGELIYSSILESNPSGSTSYRFDASGKLTAFSASDSDHYNTVSIQYNEEFGAWLNDRYEVIESPEQAAVEIGLDPAVEAPVRNADAASF